MQAPVRDFLKEEKPFLCGFLTYIAFAFGVDTLLFQLDSTFHAASLFIWLLIAILWSAFGVVHHADILSAKLGEPFGTLILTFCVVGIEVSLISAVMLTGESAPTLARDTMYAVLMIVISGLVGLALLIGAIKHHEQEYSLQGARAYLSVLMPLSVFALVLPALMSSNENAFLSTTHAIFFTVTTVALYGVFVAIQTTRHTSFFEQPSAMQKAGDHEAAVSDDLITAVSVKSMWFHTVMLVLTFLPIVLLSSRVAHVVDYGIVQLGAPHAIGGIIIALIVLLPESMAALKSAVENKLQRSVNLLLGSALATVGLTLPAVLIISLVTSEPLILGLEPASSGILLLSLVISMMTFGGAKTSVLQGAVHIVLFMAFLMLIFST